MNIFARFAQDESGATAIEYGLIAALISVGIIVAVSTLGNTLSGVFTDINNRLTGNPAGTPP
ncbi:Flp family type IVb pilin [Devosia sp. YIM 151766]|uniref:Flp family type IVb pilin n=1 Tax=Devosia sp. YIM 151766 TaxID=3017325 RepID=UPI00255C8D3C|nr:Flp family type IVb pilin [Devosia sp. YIM 151766]WIY53321.1 Flp family type IVb pilin [Devosia sp. YIM 151766]